MIFSAVVRKRLFVAVAPSVGEARFAIRLQVLTGLPSGSNVYLDEIEPEALTVHGAEHVVGKRADRFRKLHGKPALTYGAGNVEA